MKVAVTGAAGYVGTNLVNLLVEQGNEVIAIDRTRSVHARKDAVTWVDGDVLDRASMEKALGGTEIVYHLVAMITLAQKDELAWNVNTQGVRTVAEAALAVGVRRMVHCSSIHSFDQVNCGPLLSETSSRSVDPALPVYDRSKWQGEIELREVVDSGLDAVICNPTGVYGPADYSNSRVNGLLRSAARGRIPAFVDGGFDFVDVRDVAAGLIGAGQKGRTGENYLLSGHMLALTEALRLAAGVVGRRGPLFSFPSGVLGALIPILEPIGAKLGSDVLSKAAMSAVLAAPPVDGSKARAELGYQPRPAEETIRDLIAFYVDSGQFER